MIKAAPLNGKEPDIWHVVSPTVNLYCKLHLHLVNILLLMLSTIPEILGSIRVLVQ